MGQGPSGKGPTKLLLREWSSVDKVSYAKSLLCDPDATARGRGGQGDEDMWMEGAQDHAALRAARGY